MNTSAINLPIPKELPKDFNRLSFNYQLRVTLAILSILLFFTLYFSLVVGLGYLVYYALIYDIGYVNKLTILGKLGAIAGSVMLFVFTLKFIFNLKNPKPNNRILLHKKDYPNLYEFVYEICKQTNAPKPKNIYADPDVNAYVAYSNIWLSLFFPTKKDLTIGLGLVGSLNISEFKAVTAHEFGHFAQKSMKIGSYIHSANLIIHDMIFSRDKFDNLLDQWRNSDIRLSFAAWIITPVIWLIRQILQLFYMFLNIMYSSLSREMEFNADKVAVRATGSMAIVSALWKLEDGFARWNTILNHGFHAVKKNLFSKNLYEHLAISVSKDLPVLTEKLDSLPNDQLGGKHFFSSEEHSKVNMYASHPPNSLREKNAKTPFVDCFLDERSAWLVFDNAIELQEEMTSLIYEKYIAKKPENYVSIATLEKFIEDESIDNSLSIDYFNTFENRFLNIPKILEIQDVPNDFQQLDHNGFVAKLNELKEELQDLMKPIFEIEEVIVSVQKLANGESKQKAVVYKEVTYSKKQLQQCFDVLISDREFLFNNHLNTWDKKFLQFHYQLAKKNSLEKELLNRYIQHKCITIIYQELVAAKNTMVSGIHQLQTMGEVTHEQLLNVSSRIKEVATKINTSLNDLDAIDYVSLKNIETITELKEAIIDNKKIDVPMGSVFDEGKLDPLFNAIETGILNCNRVEKKSLIEILHFHKMLISR